MGLPAVHLYCTPSLTWAPLNFLALLGFLVLCQHIILHILYFTVHRCCPLTKEDTAGWLEWRWGMSRPGRTVSHGYCSCLILNSTLLFRLRVWRCAVPGGRGVPARREQVHQVFLPRKSCMDVTMAPGSCLLVPEQLSQPGHC